MREKLRLNVTLSYYLVGILPIIVAMLVFVVFYVNDSAHNLSEGTYRELRAAAAELRQHYLEDMANGIEPEYSHEYVDALTEYDIQMTLFVGDTRFVTSVRDDNNPSGRNEGTKAASGIYERVAGGGGELFDKGVPVGNDTYYVCYLPILNNSGNMVGMAFAGTPDAMVRKSILTGVKNAVIIAVVLMLVLGALVSFVGRRIQEPIGKIIKYTERMSTGDLTVDIDCKSKLSDINGLIESQKILQDEFRKITGELNKNIDVMNELVVSLSESSREAKYSTDNVSKAIDGVAYGASQQAHNTHEAQNAVVNIGKTIEQVLAESKNLIKSVDTMTRIKNNTVQNMEAVMFNTDKAIENIHIQSQKTNESAKEISKAVEIITSIAAQTNLLSLNASIEAARAGDAGKGFAVVANEIRDLADQSNNSATEIQEIVAALMVQADNTLKQSNNLAEQQKQQEEFVNDTKRAFNELGAAIDVTSHSADTIAVSVDEVNRAKTEILGLVEELSAISEENAASAEETTASAQVLNQSLISIDGDVVKVSKMSEDLVEVMSFFNN